MTKSRFLASMLAISLLDFTLVASTVFADQADWPQWRGANRDGHAGPQELLQNWPEGGPKLKWSFTNAGHGYSAVSVVDGAAFTMGSRDGGCFVICIDADTGQQLWETRIGDADAEGDYNSRWGGGPRSTPTVDGDQVFVVSDTGVVAALNKSGGSLQWSKDYVSDFGGKIPTWGYAESLLVDGDRVLCTPGGENFMVGLDRNTGDRVWSSEGVNEGAQYVSIMRGSAGGTSFYLTASKAGLVAFDTETGKELFRDSATGNKTAVIPTPVLDGEFIFHSSAYGAGNTLLKLSGASGSIAAESVYELQGKTLENHHGGFVLLGGVIYGFTKANGGNWTAQEMSTGKTLWEEKIRPNRSGSICLADGRLYCYNDKDGTVFLVAPSREGWQPKGSLKLPQETSIPRQKGAIWAHPVVADQMLLIRDQDLIYSFDIAR